MRQPDNLPAFCRVLRNGRPLIGMSAGWSLEEPESLMSTAVLDWCSMWSRTRHSATLGH
jgi:hypothetical protein